MQGWQSGRVQGPRRRGRRRTALRGAFPGAAGPSHLDVSQHSQHYLGMASWPSWSLPTPSAPTLLLRPARLCWGRGGKGQPLRPPVAEEGSNQS